LKIRFLILLSAVVAVALLLWGGQTLMNQLSGEQKKIQQEILRRESALSKRIQVRVLETGFRQSRSGHPDVYFPGLAVEVDNLSRDALTKIKLVSYFKKNGGVICSASFDIAVLQSGEAKVAAIFCSQSTGLKSSRLGYRQVQKERSISFELWLEAVEISMVVDNGKIQPRVVSSSLSD
jgi:hypothetical protein